MTHIRPGRITAALALAVLVPAGFLSCPNPLSHAISNRVKDKIPPVIAITAPSEGASYPATVVVTGSVKDFSTPGGDPGAVRSLRYEIVPATIAGGTVSFGQDGTFSFSFPTARFTGTMVIKLTAEDWNGNTSTASVTLLNKGAIPSFTAIPGNRQVSLAWDPVPLATSYTLFYTTNGSPPAPEISTRVDSVVSGVKLSGLTNGAAHVFRLQAHSSQGDDNWSADIRAVPLSSFTLTPRVSCEATKIMVEWNAVPATDEYEVLRADQKDGSYINVSGTLKGTQFSDPSVVSGRRYWYKVRLHESPAISSYPTMATAAVFSSSQERVTGAYSLAYTEGIALRGGQVFLVSAILGGNAFAAIDLSTPRTPRLIGSISGDTGAGGDSVVVGTDRALVYWTFWFNTSGVHVIDISNPASPADLGDLAIPFGRAAFYGRFACEAAGNSGLRIWDLTNPLSPVQVGSCALPGYADYISVLGSHAYVACGSSGLQVVNVGDPAHPSVEGACPTPGTAGKVCACGTRAYVQDSTGVVCIVDISQPSPYIMGSRNVPADYVAWSANATSLMFGRTGSVIEVYDESDPAASSLVSTFTTLTSIKGLGATLADLFVADELGGLLVYDLAVPTAPPVVGSCELGAYSCYSHALDGDIAYVATYERGVHIVNVASPVSPYEIGTLGTSQTALGIAIAGNTAFVGDYSAGLLGYDVTNPSAPVPIASVPGSGAGVALWGGYLLYSDPGRGVEIFDIDVPASPSLVGVIPGGACRATVRGSTVFVAALATGVKIADISNPRAPQILGTYLTSPNQAYGVAVSGNFAYVADGDGGLLVLDFSIPASPKLAATVPAGDMGTFYDVAISGHFALIACGSGLCIIDISTPASPFIVGKDRIDTWQGLLVFGRYVYAGGLRILDLAP
jgi:hypothetical protein